MRRGVGWFACQHEASKVLYTWAAKKLASCHHTRKPTQHTHAFFSLEAIKCHIRCVPTFVNWLKTVKCHFISVFYSHFFHQKWYTCIYRAPQYHDNHLDDFLNFLHVTYKRVSLLYDGKHISPRQGNNDHKRVSFTHLIYTPLEYIISCARAPRWRHKNAPVLLLLHTYTIIF